MSNDKKWGLPASFDLAAFEATIIASALTDIKLPDGLKPSWARTNPRPFPFPTPREVQFKDLYGLRAAPMFGMWHVVEGDTHHFVASKAMGDVRRLLYDPAALPPYVGVTPLSHSQGDKLLPILEAQGGLYGARSLFEYIHLIAAQMGHPDTFLICTLRTGDLPPGLKIALEE
jgi:hypothetical protein